MSIRKPKLEDFPYFEDGIEMLDEIDMQYLVPGCRAPDCIPAIDAPIFVNEDDAIEIWGKDQTVLVLLNPENPSEAYAVPKSVLDIHEIVNFYLEDGSPVALTYCPLCDTATAYSRTLEGLELDLGVSGLLYHSAVVVYDRHSKSLFSQVYSRGIHGKFKGKELDQLPMIETSLEDFFAYFVKGQCLSNITGFPKREKRYFKNSHYDEYRSSDRLVFPVGNIDQELPLKSRVYHLKLEEDSLIVKRDIDELPDNVYKLRIHRIAGGMLFFQGESFSFENWIPAIQSYYFAARAYYPQAKLLS